MNAEWPLRPGRSSSKTEEHRELRLLRDYNSQGAKMGGRFQLCAVILAIAVCVVTAPDPKKKPKTITATDVKPVNGVKVKLGVSEAAMQATFRRMLNKYRKKNKCQCSEMPVNFNVKSHYHADFTTAPFVVPPTGTGVSWHVALTGTVPCRHRGVLKLEPPSWATKLIIDFCLNNPSGWSFNLGDSPSNNGWGGDSGHTWRCAEVHSRWDHSLVYRAYDGTNRGKMNINYFRNSVSSGPYTITVRKADPQGGYVGVNNYEGVDADIRDDLLFAWDTMYFGINRVIYGGRYGTGLCFINIRWEF